MSDAKVAFYRSIGLTGSLPDMERDFFEGSYRKVPYVLAQSAVPVCLAPNGTVATNGIVTLGTALPATYSGGIWLRLPANAVVGGLAGLYWAVMSSTTQGQVYTNFSDPATQFIPSIPSGTLVAAVGSNVAYTQATGADITLVNVTVPGGSMGVNGGLRNRATYSCNNSGGNKIGRIALDGLLAQNTTLTTTTGGAGQQLIQNRGVATRQYQSIGGPTTGFGSGFASVNTGVDKPLSIIGQIAVATDYLVIEGVVFEVLPS